MSSRKRGAEKQLTKFDDVDSLVENSESTEGGRASAEVLAKRKQQLQQRQENAKTAEDREAERIEQEKIKEKKKQLSWDFPGAEASSSSSSSSSTVESSFGSGETGEWGDFTSFEASDWTTESLNPFQEEAEESKGSEFTTEEAPKTDKLTDFTEEAADWNLDEGAEWEFQSTDEFSADQWGDTFPSEDGKAFIDSAASSSSTDAADAPQEEPAPEEPANEGEPDETKRWLGEVTFLHYTTNPDLETEKSADSEEPPKAVPEKRWVDHGAVSFCVLTRVFEGKNASRIIVRTPGTRKLLLNLRITALMKSSQEKTGIRITGINSEGKTELFFVKPSSKTTQSEDLFTVITDEVKKAQ